MARRAIDKGTGARGLRAVLEQGMLEVMFHLPDRDDVREVVITQETVEDGADPLLILEPEARRKEA